MEIAPDHVIGYTFAHLAGLPEFDIQWIANLLDPIISVLASGLVIVIGGLLSWRIQRWWTKPILDSGNTELMPWRPHNLANTDVYRVPVKNTGRRAAKNCKAQIFVEFISGTTRYKIEASLPWAGNDNIHSTINPGETSYFNLLARDGANNMISVPSNSNFQDDGLILQYPISDEGSVPVISTKIGTQLISEADIVRMEYKVTSENCSAISRDFVIESEGVPQLG